MSLTSHNIFRPGALSSAALMIALVTGQASADTQSVESTLTAFEVTLDETGNEHLNPALEIMPGGVIEYHLNYVNHSAEPLGGFVIEGDIPEATAYIINSQSIESGAIFEARSSDVDWSRPPLIRYVEDETGVLRPETVPAVEYNAIRWRLFEPLESEAQIETVYRIRVDR